MSGHLLLAVLGAVLGLALGSFLNVVVHRVPLGQSIAFPASHCPACETPLKRRHNVPVLSWVALRGHCAFCAAPIGARYPLIEAATGALLAGIAYGYWPLALLGVVAALWLTAFIALRRADYYRAQLVPVPITLTTRPHEGATPWLR